MSDDAGVIIKGEDGSYYKLSHGDLQNHKMGDDEAAAVEQTMAAKRSGKGEDFCIFGAASHVMVDMGWARKNRSD